MSQSPFPEGVALLHDPALNKGTAFTESERSRLGLRGLLPPRVMTQKEQVTRVLGNVRAAGTDLDRYVILTALLDRNERLFFRLVIDHIAELMPILYTPTVGDACEHFSQLFRRPRGIYVCARDRGRMREVLRNWPSPSVSIVVATDGGRILGLGDLGTNGMAIPIGKLVLYTAGAGVDPGRCLPVMLDVGTDNARLRADPLYLGVTEPRLGGRDYAEFIEEFVTATEEVFPGALLQFEDFATANAIGLLDRYRDRICAFNDDIQGTASVALAGMYSAGRLTGRPLRGQQIVFLGAGAAATGIANLIEQALVKEGLSPGAARQAISLVDSSGLITRSRSGLEAGRLRYAQDRAPIPDLLGVVEALNPTALIGVSAAPHTFSEPVLRLMAERNERPIIFALSNPTSRAECTAEQAYRWTGGRAVFASGSPFPAVELDRHRHVPRQANNAYVFPGLGLGVTLVGARRVTQTMFAAAARRLASLVTEADLAQGSLYPPMEEIWEVSAEIAEAVAEVAYDEGLATIPRPVNLAAFIRAQRYDPDYDNCP